MEATNLTIPKRFGQRKESNSVLFFFFVWPLASFFYALYHTSNKYARLTIVLFYGFFCYFYPFSFDDNIDVVRHAERFEFVASLPFTDFFEQLAVLYISESYKPDILQSFIEFVVSRFTDSYRIYFMVLGLIMGTALTQLLKLITFKGKEKGLWFFSLLFLLFIVVLLPPYRIGGFRQVTGLLVFCVGVYRVLVDGKNKYIFLIISTGLIHFSFLVILPFYFLTYVVRDRFWMYYIFIIGSFLLNDQAHLLIGEWGSDLQGQLGSRVRGYSNEEYIEFIRVIKQNRNVLIDNQVRWTAYFFFFSLLYVSRKIIEKKSRILYALSLSVFAFLMFVSNLETTFVRFSLLYIVLCCVIYLRLLKQIRFEFVFRQLMIVAFLFNFIIMTRKTIEYTGIQVLIPNVIASFFVEANMSVWEILN